MPEEPTSFWQHIDIFRKYLLRCVVVFAVVFVAVFCCKEQLFEIVFSPQQNDAFIFTFFNKIAQHFGINSISDVDIPIINTGLFSMYCFIFFRPLLQSGGAQNFGEMMSFLIVSIITINF